MTDWREWPIQRIYIREIGQEIWLRGKWSEGYFDKTLAIVGSRRLTRYGQSVLEKFVPTLVAEKIVTVSGFMYGTDSLAHQLTVKSGGRTVAVLGCGLNVLATFSNNELYTQILESGGLVISEYEHNFQPTLWSFPRRNKIVAGLSNLGVLVTEAGEKSGSLITARLARKMNRNVWAVPGPINSSVSTGTNWLIAEGLAKLVTRPEEILERRICATQTGLPIETDRLSKD